MKYLIFILFFPITAFAESITVALYEDHEQYSKHSRAYQANWVLLQEAAAIEGITLKASPYLWIRGLEELKQDKIDAVIGAYFSKERSALYYFSKPFSQDPIFLFRSANSAASTTKIKNALVGVTSNSIGESLVSNNKKFSVYKKSSSKEVFNLLQNGRLDYAVFSQSVAHKHCLTDANIKLKKDCLVPVGSAIKNNGFHIMFSKKPKNRAIQKRIDFAVDTLISDGKAKAIYLESGYSAQEYKDWLGLRNKWHNE